MKNYHSLGVKWWCLINDLLKKSGDFRQCCLLEKISFSLIVNQILMMIIDGILEFEDERWRAGMLRIQSRSLESIT